MRKKTWRLPSIVLSIFLLVSPLLGLLAAKEYYKEGIDWEVLTITPRDWPFILVSVVIFFFLFYYALIRKYLRLPGKPFK